MAKSTGLGDDFFWAGYHIGNNTASLENIHGGPAPLDVTDITQSGHARLGGLRDGGMQVTVFMDPAAAQEHAAFSPLPRTDSIATYCRGQAVGNPAACCVAKQLNYDSTRASSGMLTFKVEGQGDGYGLEWGVQLTPGVRTDTTATTGAFYDQGSGGTQGCQGYLQIVSFTGSNVDVTVTHATTSGGAYSTLLDFSSQTGIGAWRATASGTVNEFLKVVTAGTFSNVVFNVMFAKNKTATVF